MASGPKTGAADRRTILVVDGDILVRLVIADYLRQCGYRVVEAASADEALTVLGMKDVDIHVVLADVDIGGSLSGFGLAQWLRDNRPGVAVLLASDPKRTAVKAESLCRQGPHLGRPYDAEIVHDRIRRLLAGAYVSASGRTAPSQPRRPRPFRGEYFFSL